MRPTVNAIVVGSAPTRGFTFFALVLRQSAALISATVMPQKFGGK